MQRSGWRGCRGQRSGSHRLQYWKPGRECLCGRHTGLRTSRRNPSCESEHRRYKVVGKQTWANRKHSLIDHHKVSQLFWTWEGLGVSLICHLIAIIRFHLPLGVLPYVPLHMLSACPEMSFPIYNPHPDLSSQYFPDSECSQPIPFLSPHGQLTHLTKCKSAHSHSPSSPLPPPRNHLSPLFPHSYLSGRYKDRHHF